MAMRIANSISGLLRQNLTNRRYIDYCTYLIYMLLSRRPPVFRCQAMTTCTVRIVATLWDSAHAACDDDLIKLPETSVGLQREPSFNI